MRYPTLVAVILFVMGAAAGAATADDSVMAPIQKFIDSFNKGDMAGAAATHSATADLTIIDEIAPYVWQGPQALQAWSADLADYAKKQGMTDQVVVISAPTREETSPDHAYVVVPAVYSFKAGGVAMREPAQMVIVLQKGDAGWLIHSWAWTGSKPQAVASTK